MFSLINFSIVIAILPKAQYSAVGSILPPGGLESKAAAPAAAQPAAEPFAAPAVSTVQARAVGTGRGRDLTLPAWQTQGDASPGSLVSSGRHCLVAQRSAACPAKIIQFCSFSSHLLRSDDKQGKLALQIVYHRPPSGLQISA